MAAPSNGGQHIVFPARIDGRDHVRHIRATRDQGGSAIDHRVIDLPRVVIAVVAGLDNLAAQAVLELFHGHCSHAFLHTLLSLSHYFYHTCLTGTKPPAAALFPSGWTTKIGDCTHWETPCFACHIGCRFELQPPGHGRPRQLSRESKPPAIEWTQAPAPPPPMAVLVGRSAGTPLWSQPGSERLLVRGASQRGADRRS